MWTLQARSQTMDSRTTARLTLCVLAIVDRRGRGRRKHNHSLIIVVVYLSLWLRRYCGRRVN